MAELWCSVESIHERQARFLLLLLLLLLVEMRRLLVIVWYMSYICEAGCQSFTQQQTVYQSGGRLLPIHERPSTYLHTFEESTQKLLVLHFGHSELWF